MPRTEIPLTTINQTVDDVLAELLEQRRQKGPLSYVSSHECLGVLLEEFDELTDAVRENNQERVAEELTDIAVGALFSLASMKIGAMDW